MSFNNNIESPDDGRNPVVWAFIYVMEVHLYDGDLYK